MLCGPEGVSHFNGLSLDSVVSLSSSYIRNRIGSTRMIDADQLNRTYVFETFFGDGESYGSNTADYIDEYLHSSLEMLLFSLGGSIGQ